MQKHRTLLDNTHTSITSSLSNGSTFQLYILQTLFNQQCQCDITFPMCTPSESLLNTTETSIACWGFIFVNVRISYLFRIWTDPSLDCLYASNHSCNSWWSFTNRNRSYLVFLSSLGWIQQIIDSENQPNSDEKEKEHWFSAAKTMDKVDNLLNRFAEKVEYGAVPGDHGDSAEELLPGDLKLRQQKKAKQCFSHSVFDRIDTPLQNALSRNVGSVDRGLHHPSEWASFRRSAVRIECIEHWVRYFRARLSDHGHHLIADRRRIVYYGCKSRRSWTSILLMSKGDSKSYNLILLDDYKTRNDHYFLNHTAGS